jgi:hypothetical protein
MTDERLPADQPSEAQSQPLSLDEETLKDLELTDESEADAVGGGMEPKYTTVMCVSNSC